MKKNKIIMILLIMLFFVTGCYSEEDEELAKEYRKQGEINAINYVKEKYNINPKVESVVEEANCSSLWGCLESSPNGDVTVKLNYNNKDFYVYVTGEYNSTDAIDDYQFKEIEEDYINYLRNNINLDLYDYKLEFYKNGIKEYYNKALDVVSPYIFNIELYYIGEYDLNELDLTNIEQKFKNNTMSINIMEFKTQEKCDDYKQSIITHAALTDGMKDIYKYSMIKIYKGQKTFYKYDNISNYNDEVYVYSPQDTNKYEISISKIDDLNKYRESYQDLNDKELIMVSNAYSIPSSKSLLYIYFPMDKVNATQDDKVYFIAECNTNKGRKYYIENYYGLKSIIKIESVGNYYIEKIRYSQCNADSQITFGLIKINN